MRPLAITIYRPAFHVESEWILPRSFAEWPVLSLAAPLVVVLYCFFTLSSIALFPKPFSPFVNYLSDLGNSAFNPYGAWLYNTGCILTGLALFPFFAGLYSWYPRERLKKALVVMTQAVGFTSAFALIMIGVFSEDYLAQHLFWSDLFFVLNLLVLILANASLMTQRNFIRLIGYYGFAVAAINVLFVLLSNTPVLEWFTVFSALGYAGMLAYNTWKIRPSIGK
jgi:hypothetical membrane protein